MISHYVAAREGQIFSGKTLTSVMGMSWEIPGLEEWRIRVKSAELHLGGLGMWLDLEVVEDEEDA